MEGIDISCVIVPGQHVDALPHLVGGFVGKTEDTENIGTEIEITTSANYKFDATNEYLVEDAVFEGGSESKGVGGLIGYICLPNGISVGAIPVKSCSIRITVGSSCPSISSFNKS